MEEATIAMASDRVTDEVETCVQSSIPVLYQDFTAAYIDKMLSSLQKSHSISIQLQQRRKRKRRDHDDDDEHMNDEDGRRHLMMWIDKCKKTKRNPVEASTGKSRCKELNGPVAEEGSSKRDPEAGDCSLDLI
uniref:Uncharacterized protein n=1 Tax=Salix viminalis TaxID=40686 RepID=A0A6N2K6F8_SALVM